MIAVGSFLAATGGFLADDFSFLPPQILASAFSALDCAGCVSYSTFSADFHVEPVLLGKSFLERIHYWQFNCSPLVELSYDSNHPLPKYVFPSPQASLSNRQLLTESLIE